jgi:hypothetical protein
LFPTAAAVSTIPMWRDAVSHLLRSEFYTRMVCVSTVIFLLEVGGP